MTLHPSSGQIKTLESSLTLFFLLYLISNLLANTSLPTTSVTTLCPSHWHLLNYCSSFLNSFPAPSLVNLQFLLREHPWFYWNIIHIMSHFYSKLFIHSIIDTYHVPARDILAWRKINKFYAFLKLVIY